MADRTTAEKERAEQERDDEEIAFLSRALIENTVRALELAHTSSGNITYREDVISEDKMLQVAIFAFRDLDRVERDHPNGISVTKYVAYIGFWYGKLKPITRVMYQPANGDAFEIVDVNERLALVVIERLLWRMAWGRNRYPTVWKDCQIASCSHTYEGKTLKGRCFLEKNAGFLSHQHRQHADYISYTLRHRSTSPYFLVNYLEEGLYYSCEQACPPMFKTEPNPS